MQGTAEAAKPVIDDNDRLYNLCNETLSEYLRKPRLHPEKVYRERLEHEFKVYRQSGYASIILIISDYIRWARKNNVVVGPGRGSAAGSLVVFLAQITTIDPLRFGLIFERFLNPERISLPDIDTDFSDRDKVIDYLASKYGQNRIAKVGVPSLYKPRSTVDEFAQLYNLEFGESKKITKAIGDAKTFDEAFEAEPVLKAYEEKYPELFAYARRLAGTVRLTTTHPSAVILTKNPIGSEIPMIRPPGENNQGRLATGWDGEELDGLGYVKLDILTVDNLTIINKAIELIGGGIDFYNLPLNDKKTLEGFELGETVGVFQFEEQKTVSILQRLRDMKFMDIAAVNALIRPGLDVDQFINARDTGVAEYVIPELEPILGDTHGVILYQEQVMRICVDLAGFTMAKADKVRKIIAKTANQRSDKGLAEVYEDFKKGYLAKGLNPDRFEMLWEKILACQNYIFNKSHAVCYGYIAYADMFLKRHYPLQFMCAALQVRSKENYIKECDRLGIKVLPPCVKKSEVEYKIEGDAIRIGLSNIKHVGAKAKQIVDRAPYADEFDFVNRAKLNAKQIESAVFSGALDIFGERKSIAKMLCKQSIHDEVGIGELATKEKENLGFYLQYNPLAFHKADLRGCITPETQQTKTGFIGGMVSRVKEHQTKSGTFMAFVAILTEDGEMDTMVWPKDWANSSSKLVQGNIVKCYAQKTDRGGYSISQVALLREQK